jgi:hypothetical protein
MEVVCDWKLRTRFLSARIFGHILYIVCRWTLLCVCLQCTECAANSENFVSASASCLLISTDISSTYGWNVVRDNALYAFSMWVTIFVTRWLLCDRRFKCSSTIFLFQCVWSLQIFYIIVCDKISSVFVDTLIGGKSGLLIVLYVFYSVINPLICYKWNWGIQEKVVQTSSTTVNSCLALLGF